MIRLAVVLTCIALLAAAPAPKLGATVGTFGVWTVHVSSVDYHRKTGDFSTPNHVTMTRTGGDINADRASGNDKRHTVTFFGHVVVHDNGSGLSAMGNAPAAGQGPATLLTDRLQVDSKARVYIAIGNVHYTKGTTVVDAAKATLEAATHMMYLEGNVHMIQGANSIWADSIAYDTLTGKGTAQAADGTLQFPARTPR